MGHEVIETIEKSAKFFRERAPQAEDLGRLPDDTAQAIKDSGLVRMLQPKEFGGLEAHPCEFLEAVMALGSSCGASGWVSGVVGVHPWELALFDTQVQEEIWGTDPDTWIASPYAPMGRARPVDGGFIFNGRWPFSSGTDHCEWAVLGGIFVDADGNPTTEARGGHFVLPRSDYEIVQDSWQVAGLKGTGSKDLVVKDAFIPTHRTVDEENLFSGALGAGKSALYRLPWMALFPSAITASVLGMAEGALAGTLDYQRSRVTVFQTRASEDPHVMAAIGEASAEIAASRSQLLDNMHRIYKTVSTDVEASLLMRADARRDQVAAAWRSARAVDTLYASAGGNAIRLDKPVQRFWRDIHAGLNHAVHIAGPVYQAWTGVSMGVELTGSAQHAL